MTSPFPVRPTREVALVLLALALSLVPGQARPDDLRDDDGCRARAGARREAEPCDPVVVRFATVGDSREEAGAAYLNAQDRIWLQNTRVWSRIMREIQTHRPQLLFFNGDMIMGYQDAGVAANHEAMNRQYAFWRGMVTQLLETGTYVVPVPGNHETQQKGKDAAGKTFKLSRPANEVLWRDNMGDLIVDAGRFAAITGAAPARVSATSPSDPATASADHISTDQAQLTYSFDVGTAHFTVLNTDPVGYDAHAPLAWLEADLRAARAAGARSFFVFGHKPAFTYFYPLASGVPTTATNGLDSLADLSNRDAFWGLVEQYGASYFCGHEHIYDVMQPAGGRAWQVIVGSGGSPFEADAVQPIDRTYAYAVVEVHASGRAEATTYGFGEAQGLTTVLKRWRLR